MSDNSIRKESPGSTPHWELAALDPILITLESSEIIVLGKETAELSLSPVKSITGMALFWVKSMGSTHTSIALGLFRLAFNSINGILHT
jgi:hypothetical protein